MLLKIILWYLVSLGMSLAVFPAVFTLLSKFKDKGYAFTRAIGLLFWAYLFWLSTSLGITSNTVGGIVLCFVLVLIASGVIYLRKNSRTAIFAWIKENWKIVLVEEMVYLVAFGLWTIVRSANPRIEATEKPMELAFINAILRSPSFPPLDPWLSGYAISYYYFGYVMVAMLSKVTSIASQYAFNLAIATWFALAAQGAYGLLFNLLCVWREKKEESSLQPKKIGGILALAILAPMFILVIGNSEGFLEVLYAGGVGWQQQADGSVQSSLWKWLDLKELTEAPAQPYDFQIKRGGLVWWRASRVISDYDLLDRHNEVIDEFPGFTFLLGDLHPHVLSMPFLLLVMAISFYLYILRFDFRKYSFLSLLKRAEFWLVCIVLGGLAFLNTWDFPLGIAMVTAGCSLVIFEKEKWSLRLFLDFIKNSVILVVAGICLYLPFYFGFSSQAGGILPSMSFFTRGIHFWIMFGTLLIPIIAWLVFLLFQHKDLKLGNGIKAALSIIGGLWVVSFLFGWLIAIAPAIAGLFQSTTGNSPAISKIAQLSMLFMEKQGATGVSNLISASLIRRLVEPGTWISLSLLIVIVWSLFGIKRTESIQNDAASIDPHEKPDGSRFVLLMLLGGIALVTIPEFIYLLDLFGNRMNTIFKFYFQVWILWGMAAAYGSAILFINIKNTFRWWAYGIVWVLVVLIGLVYPYKMLPINADFSKPANWTLNGLASFEFYQKGEYDAVAFLSQQEPGVVAEAIGGSYSGYARVSTYTGFPTVLGWPGHEGQWGRGPVEFGTRNADIETLYRTNSWPEAYRIILQYDIKYIYIGSLEQISYKPDINKFLANCAKIYDSNGVIIFAAP
ncbi:MAG: hypothetical protein HGA53_01750 [Anaerolineaceae bacterium]|nr:hypothetical protein [Anaerolineaceae bacterium]